MRLQQVRLRNYGQFDHLDLTIPAETHEAFGRLGVTLIVGQNGTGKTTLFRFLTDLFAEVPNPKLEGSHAIYRIKQSGHSSGDAEVAPDELPSRIIISTYSLADGCTWTSCTSSGPAGGERTLTSFAPSCAYRKPWQRPSTSGC